jgi:L-arabinose isomerase
MDEDFVLMGHDGPGHIAIAQEQPVLRSLKVFHGKRGAGLSVEQQVRHGDITILGCTQTADGRLKLIAAEGASIPGPTFRIGNTNSRLRFDLDPVSFLEAWSAEGPTHHVALGVGHRIADVEAVARLLDLELVVVGKDVAARGSRLSASAHDRFVAHRPATAHPGVR